MVSKDTTKPGELKEEVVKARKEEGQDYFDDYEREKKVFEKDSEDFGIDKFDAQVIESKSESNELEEDSYEHEEDSNEFDIDSNDSEYLYYDSNESNVPVKDSKKSKNSEDGQDYNDFNDRNNVKDDTKSSRKTFYQSHIYPMHLLENLKVCLIYVLFSYCESHSLTFPD